MKKNTKISIILFLLISTCTFAQNIQKIDPKNCRENELIEYCTQHKKENQLLQDPEIKKIIEEEKIKFDQLITKRKNESQDKDFVYKIPVVFHVLHNGGVENISDAQILDQLEILNRDYSKQNTDINTVLSVFQNITADIEIEFVLATKAPNGECFKGITRTFNVASYLGDNGSAQVDSIIAHNDVFQGVWPSNKYMNVYVCGDIGGSAGYTFRPTSWQALSMKTDIWLSHDYTGSIGTSSVSTSRTLTHEVGHWLNLSHVWGDGNNPGNPESCGIDDDVSDTPICIGSNSCSLNSNTCNDLNPSAGISSSWSFDVVDNVENYMDYSYCSKMFTTGQKERMRTALQSDVGGRNNIWTTTNLIETGANGDVYLCKTEFSSDKTIICLGENIQFTDETYNKATGWNWTFIGGTPSTSTLQDPLINYTTPGLYSVTLTATDGSSNDTETKTMYIKVINSSATLPFFDSFENYTSLQNNEKWFVSNNENISTFTLETGTGATGQKCIKLNNFNQTGDNQDEISSSTVDLSTISTPDIVTLSFKYAYRKKQSTNNESLKVFVSTDCGENWIYRKSISGNTLSQLVSSTNWTPNQNEWTTVHVTNINSTYFVENFRYKFQFNSDGGNNLFLDDINIYKGGPSSTNVINDASISENINFTNFSIFPNPIETQMNINFDLQKNEELLFTILDVTGKEIQSTTIHGENGNNLVLLDTEKLSTGIYTLLIKTSTLIINKQFIK